MKTVNPALQADLEAGATALCRCWRLERSDGLVLGFTDHDEDLAFGAVTYAAATGFVASAIESSLGLNVDGAEVAGALVAGALTEAELQAGLWDGAAVTLFLVDWQHPGRRVILFAGSIGEVSRGRTGFSAELRSLSHALNQPTGRLYQRLCDASFGDTRCKVALGPWTGSGVVETLRSPQTFEASGIGGFAAGRFTFGRLTWTGGANTGQVMEVRRHAKEDGAVLIALAEDMAVAPEPGDAFEVVAGCDKSFATCRKVFDNAVNFRGFPHMPGNDWLVSPPSKRDDNDGGKLFS